MEKLLEKLFRVNRSLTGPGVRETLSIMNAELDGVLAVHEVPSGTKAFDWTVPREWHLRGARLVDEEHGTVFDTEAGATYLHVVGYSEPVSAVMNFKEFEESGRIHTAHFVPHDAVTGRAGSLPWAVPYVTSYYSNPPTWGLCLAREQYWALAKREPKRLAVEIDSVFVRKGFLTFADAIIPGTAPRSTHPNSRDEIVLSTYCCHPAGLANNETSGLVLLTDLVNWWRSKPRRLSLRVIVAPETIGPIVYLAGADDSAESPIGPQSMLQTLQHRVLAGFTLTCVGGDGRFYVQQGRSSNLASRVASAVIPGARIIPWERRASDERQWSAPLVDLPWATIFKTHPTDPGYMHRYHTSADDLNYVHADQIRESAFYMREILTVLDEGVGARWTTRTLGEPMLGRRGLYKNVSTVGSSADSRDLLNVWSLCDGRTSLQIAESLGLSLPAVEKNLRVLEEHGITWRR